MDSTFTLPKKCALCSSEITNENDSKEHIIPNSIGGRKKVKGFICSICNRKFGNDWDAELASQLNWFSLIIGIKRESGRGEPQAHVIETIDGTRLRIHPDGTMTPEKPVFKIIKTGEQTKLSIQARTTKEYKEMIKGAKKIYPKLDEYQALKEAKFTETPLESPIKVNLQWGGPLFGRSVVKTAFAFSSKEGISHQLCGDAINYLKNADCENAPPYGFFYIRDLVKNRPTDKLFHCVAILGDETKRRLIAYVEYFGLIRFVVNLCSDYTGQELKKVYAIDPTTGQQIYIDIDLELADSELRQALNNEATPHDEYSKAANYAMGIAMHIYHNRSFEREKNKAITESITYAFKSLGVEPGGSIAVEDSQKFAALVTERFMPFILRYINTNRTSHM